MGETGLSLYGIYGVQTAALTVSTSFATELHEMTRKLSAISPACKIHDAHAEITSTGKRKKVPPNVEARRAISNVLFDFFR